MTGEMKIVLNGDARKRQESLLVLILLAILTATFLRASLLILSPLVCIILACYYRFRISMALIILAVIAGLSLVLSFYPNPFVKYKLLSLYHLFPFLLLLFVNPPTSRITNLEIFIKALTFIVVPNNILGFYQVFKNPASDDSFLGLYSEFSISINGLMLLNAILFFYYFLKFLYEKRKAAALSSLFFLTSAVMGFYGAGLAVSVMAFILSFFSLNKKAILKTSAISLVSITLIYSTLKLIKPETLEYNIANIKKITSFDIENGPRKIKSFYNYLVSYPLNVKDFLFGSGPGTFTSRSAFMVGSPSYFGKIQFIKDNEQPYYFRNYAYSLWNDSNTSKALYLDGFRNQPFSSLLAFLGEYGFIFTLCFFIFYFQMYRSTVRLYHLQKDNHKREVPFRFFKFLLILLPLLLLIDNYFEYPEIMIPLLLAAKFAQQQLLSFQLAQHEN